ncbi:GNAT family N-acetyltransferase [Paracoccus salsus]|uniref:GNAT family N-acetyltransferase n=1 Tax=Paracoccus salsus TaxID=2911061 RepID=UPI001F206177|nr:GNAT family N-acetyltransferase [Paracoccus salsus]MCF3972916.1 GNAT family N-acetyltransferase [Paracoccus salsus]
MSPTSRDGPGKPGGRLLCREPGGRIRLRGLMARDCALHTAHLLRLSPEDRRARFHSALGDRSVIAYSRGIDRDHAWIFGAFLSGTLRGVGELTPVTGTDEAELAISVEQPYQHVGIGKMLSLALILVARRVGIGKIRMSFVRDNHRMRALARDLGARTVATSGVLEGIVTVPPMADRRPRSPCAAR